MAGPTEQFLPKLKAPGTGLSLPENVGSLESHLLFPTSITGADILHPAILEVGDRWADLNHGIGWLFHNKLEATKKFFPKITFE